MMIKSHPFYQRGLIFFTIILIFVYFFIILAGAEEKEDQKTTLAAFYLVGNDIESDNILGEWGFITQNLLDMREGYGKGRGDDLMVIIAYGGADKEGWRGMHLYSLKNATADLLDNGQYDQWDSYTISYPGYNMGSKECFTEFLKSLQPYRDYDRKYLIMSGHGGAYQGAFPDENFDSGNIPLIDIKEALEESGLYFSIIGLDTCLMGSLEVASVLMDRADYLIGSEETEPSKGWNYSALAKTLVGNPDIPPKDLGKSIIDSYIPYQLNEGRGTLSLIDLSKIPALITAWDNFSSELIQAYQDPVKRRNIEEVIAKADEFGFRFYVSLNTNERLFSSYTMDAASFATDIGTAVPALADEARIVTKAVNNAVIYSKQNLRPYATGLSVYSPLHKEATINAIFEYSPAIAFSEDWYSFLIQFFRTVLADKQKPLVNNSYQGIFVNDSGYVMVDTEYVLINPYFEVILGVEPAYQSSAGYYVLPEWDGMAFHFIDTNNETIQIIPVFYQQQVNANTEEYYAFIALPDNDKSGNSWFLFDIFFDSRTGDTNIFYVDLGENEDNILSLAHSGRMNPISDLYGKGIIPFALVRYPDGTKTWKPVSDEPFILHKNVTTGYKAVACGDYMYGLIARDLNGNEEKGYEKSFSQACG